MWHSIDEETNITGGPTFECTVLDTGSYTERISYTIYLSSTYLFICLSSKNPGLNVVTDVSGMTKMTYLFKDLPEHPGIPGIVCL